MQIGLEKASGLAKCRSESCPKNPEYISKAGRIKSGTTCVCISMQSAAGWHSTYYCRDCIEQIYIDMRKVLDPKLWALM